MTRRVITGRPRRVVPLDFREIPTVRENQLPGLPARGTIIRATGINRIFPGHHFPVCGLVFVRLSAAVGGT
jgi:hypothetical protein